ncbi:hypothetical protein CFE70_003215 [Pyrenophora teres f. teres 0-1]
MSEPCQSNRRGASFVNLEVWLGYHVSQWLHGSYANLAQNTKSEAWPTCISRDENTLQFIQGWRRSEFRVTGAKNDGKVLIAV